MRSWMLTCDCPNGQVLESRPITVGRGASVTPNLVGYAASFWVSRAGRSWDKVDVSPATEATVQTRRPTRAPRCVEHEGCVIECGEIATGKGLPGANLPHSASG